jgi:general secretion pathway protein I
MTFCSRRGPARGASGFTLIEVLVALAIVAITLATGIKAAGALVQNGQRLATVSAAQWCADNALTGLKLARQFPGVGDSDFTCEQLGASYVGKLVVRPTPNPNFRRVEAFIADAEGYPLLSLSTVLPRN